ncbi:MAG TPA: hypothetical protein DCE42_08530 [Myxococcales bacterium]|nr:hypothetical protein [Deltaproteobacteria bacterium]HAA54791.1 hypothetical protein [Myxococcales bacterium]
MQLAFSIIIVASCVYVCLDLVATYFLTRPKDIRHFGEDAPGVSILKPAKGADDDLYENIASFCQLTYPNYELIVCIADKEDPAWAVTERVIEAYPETDIRLIQTEPSESLNPKVASLETMARHMKHDLMLISDSNVRVTPDYLSDMVQAYEPEEVGIVTNLICGSGEETVAAAFENLFLNGIVLAGFVFMGFYVRQPQPIGKSMLFSYKKFVELGGFAPYYRKIATEDIFMYRRFEKAGYKAAYGSLPIFNHNRQWRMSQLIERHLRWARVRLRTVPGPYLIEPIASPLFASLVWLVASAGHPNALVGFGCAYFVEALRHALHAKWLGRTLPSLLTFLLLPVFATGHVLLIAIAPWKSTISWRGKEYNITWQTDLVDDTAE